MERAHASRLVALSTTLSLSLGCGGIFGNNGGMTYNPPPPEPRQNLYFVGPGQCELVVNVDCPPPDVATCNPPPPMPTDCPPIQVHSVERTADGTCTQSAYVASCPPDTSCGEVPSQGVPCPPALAELSGPGRLQKQYSYGCYVVPEATGGHPVVCPPELEAPARDDYTYTVQGNGLCIADAKNMGDCPPGASCNPPPPEDVICPPGVSPTP